MEGNVATQYTAKINRKRIIKMGIWSNQKSRAKIKNVYAELQKKYPGKEIYICNAGFFDMKTFKPIFGLKCDGEILSNDWGKGWIGFNGKNIIYHSPSVLPNDCTDAVSGYPVLIENGLKSKLFTHCVDNSDRGRTMLGFNNDEVILSVISDVSGSSDFTLDEELNYMLNQKCTYAINLDGGGSSQCIFNGKTITSSRIVNNFIYIVADPDTNICPYIEPTKALKKGAKGENVKWLQWHLNKFGYNLTIDGSFGPGTDLAFRDFQKKHGLKVDGSCGPASRKVLKEFPR